jgi:hypothetical protein
MNEKIKTRVVVSKYFEAGEVTPPFNSIMFKNEGTTTVILNGFQILPTEVYRDNGTYEEFNFTIYRWRFDGRGVNRLIVIKKDIVNGL